MTAFAKSDIPSTITTIEQLHCWTGLVLEIVNPDLTVIEGSGSAVPACDTGIFDVPQTKETRLICRASLAVNQSFSYSGKKFWEEIKELSSNSLPQGFKDIT